MDQINDYVTRVPHPRLRPFVAAALARTSEHLEAVAPAFATELVDRVSHATTWRTRWAILDEIFLRVLNLDREMPVELERAWAIMLARHGDAAVSELADLAGCRDWVEFAGSAPTVWIADETMPTIEAPSVQDDRD